MLVSRSVIEVIGADGSEGSMAILRGAECNLPELMMDARGC